jgi:hypothetical protein
MTSFIYKIASNIINQLDHKWTYINEHNEHNEYNEHNEHNEYNKHYEHYLKNSFYNLVKNIKKNNDNNKIEYIKSISKLLILYGIKVPSLYISKIIITITKTTQRIYTKINQLDKTQINRFNKLEKQITRLVTRLNMLSNNPSVNTTINTTLKCPITRDTIIDPVFCIIDSRIYEKEAILCWINQNGRSPLTRAYVTNNDLKPVIGMLDETV